MQRELRVACWWGVCSGREHLALWFFVVQWLSHVRLFVTQWTAARQASLSFTISQSLLKFISINLVTPSKHLILCCPLLLLSSIFPSIRVFSNELAFPMVGKYWSSSFSNSSSNEYSGLISIRIYWFHHLVVQGILKSILQYHSLKASILRLFSLLYGLSHLYMNTGKTIVSTLWTFVRKVMYLLFNTLSSFIMGLSRCP